MPGDKWWSFANTHVGGPNIEMTKKKKKEYDQKVLPLCQSIFPPVAYVGVSASNLEKGRTGKGREGISDFIGMSIECIKGNSYDQESCEGRLQPMKARHDVVKLLWQGWGERGAWCRGGLCK